MLGLALVIGIAAGTAHSERAVAPLQCDGPCIYWHAKAVKRLRLLGARERRIVVLLTRLRAAGGQSRSRAPGRSADAQPSPSASASATWYGPGFYGHGNACGTGTLSESSWWVATVPRQCGRRFTICDGARCVHVTAQDTGGFTPGNFDLTPAVARALGGLYTHRVRWSSP